MAAKATKFELALMIAESVDRLQKVQYRVQNETDRTDLAEAIQKEIEEIRSLLVRQAMSREV